MSEPKLHTESVRVACFQTTQVYVVENGVCILDANASSMPLADQMNNFLDAKNVRPVMVSSPSVSVVAHNDTSYSHVLTCSMIYAIKPAAVQISTQEAANLLEKLNGR